MEDPSGRCGLRLLPSELSQPQRVLSDVGRTDRPRSQQQLDDYQTHWIIVLSGIPVCVYTKPVERERVRLQPQHIRDNGKWNILGVCWSEELIYDERSTNHAKIKGA